MSKLSIMCNHCARISGATHEDPKKGPAGGAPGCVPGTAAWIYSGAVSQSRRNGLVMPASVPVRLHGLAAPMVLRCRKLLDVEHRLVLEHVKNRHCELMCQ